MILLSSKSGKKIEIVYENGLIIRFESLSAFAKSLSMSIHRVRNLLKGRKVLTEAKYHDFVEQSFKLPQRGCLPGQKRIRK